MADLLRSVLAGLIGAAVIHIVVLFLTPHYSERDAWSRLEERGGLLETIALTDPPAGSPPLLTADPLIRAVACRFSLADGPVQLVAPQGAVFWSLSAYGRKGLNVFSINDKTADAAVDIVFALPFQAVELRKELPEELAASVIVEIGEPEGLVVLRAFQPDWTYAAAVDRFLANASCRQV